MEINGAAPQGKKVHSTLNPQHFKFWERGPKNRNPPTTQKTFWGATPKPFGGGVPGFLKRCGFKALWTFFPCGDQPSPPTVHFGSRRPLPAPASHRPPRQPPAASATLHQPHPSMHSQPHLHLPPPLATRHHHTPAIAISHHEPQQAMTSHGQCQLSHQPPSDMTNHRHPQQLEAVV